MAEKIKLRHQVLFREINSYLWFNVWEDFKEKDGTNRTEFKHYKRDYKCDKSKNDTSTLFENQVILWSL